MQVVKQVNGGLMIEIWDTRQNLIEATEAYIPYVIITVIQSIFLHATKMIY